MLEREKGQRSDCWLRVRERKNKMKEQDKRNSDKIW